MGGIDIVGSLASWCAWNRIWSRGFYIIQDINCIINTVGTAGNLRTLLVSYSQELFIVGKMQSMVVLAMLGDNIFSLT